VDRKSLRLTVVVSGLPFVRGNGLTERKTNVCATFKTKNPRQKKRKPGTVVVSLSSLRSVLLLPPRDHSFDALLKSNLWLVTKNPPSLFDIVPPHTTTKRNPEPGKHVGFPP